MAASKPFAWGFTLLGVAIVVWGIYQGLYVVPPDFRQGDAAKIMFVHVPSSWLTAVHLRSSWQARVSSPSSGALPLADICAKSCAPIGAVFTALCLFTGSVWGKPMWGTWWEWSDPRIVSVADPVLLLSRLHRRSGRRWRRRRRPRAPPPSSAWSARSTCRSSTTRSNGGTRCTRPRPSSPTRRSPPASTRWPMYITFALGYLSLFGGLTLFNMRAEVNLTPRRDADPAQTGRRLMPTLDKYAPYIFSAYGVAIVALVGLVVVDGLARRSAAQKKLDAAEARRAARRRSREAQAGDHPACAFFAVLVVVALAAADASRIRRPQSFTSPVRPCRTVRSPTSMARRSACRLQGPALSREHLGELVHAVQASSIPSWSRWRSRMSRSSASSTRTPTSSGHAALLQRDGNPFSMIVLDPRRRSRPRCRDQRRAGDFPRQRRRHDHEDHARTDRRSQTSHSASSTPIAPKRQRRPAQPASSS